MTMPWSVGASPRSSTRRKTSRAVEKPMMSGARWKPLANCTRMLPSWIGSLGHRDAGELIETLRELHPRMPVLVLSVHDEIFDAERVLRAGAVGYVMKQEATDRII